MKSKKLIKYGIILVAILIVFIIIGQSRGWIGSHDGYRVTTDKAERRDIIEVVTANGKIRPVTEVKISPDVSGEVVKLNVEEGDYVEHGDLLVRINPDVYESMLDRAIASLNTNKANLASSRSRKVQAEAQYVNAESSYLRNKKLFEEDAISRSEYDAALSQYQTAKAEVESAEQSIIAAQYQVKSAEASVREARDNLTKTNIFSPMNGTLSRLDTEVGERVVGTSQYAGTEIMRIANLNNMEVLVDVNENDIIRVSEGDTALIDVDAYLGEQFLGVVTSIANSARDEALSSEQVTNFEVRIKILSTSYEHLLDDTRVNVSPFRPGMSATVDIQTQKAFDVISIPIQAVTTRDVDMHEEQDSIDVAEGNVNNKTEITTSGIREYVFAYDKGIAKLISVKSGVQDLNYIEISEGLDLGDEIIIGPYRAVSSILNDGDMVNRVERHALFSD